MFTKNEYIIREVMRQLENEQHYFKLSEDPTDLFAEEIKITLEEMVRMVAWIRRP